MGRKERREREEKRESYSAQRSREKRKTNLIAIGVFAIIAVIVGYSVYVFANMDQSAVPGGPENAGAFGSAHDHAGILVKIFGDTFDFDGVAYQIKSQWIHFEGNDGTTIHKHATGVTLGFLFDTLGLGLDDQCFVFKDGKSFCATEDYSMKFFINGEPVDDIRDHVITEDDKILISYGADEEELESQLLELEAQELLKR
jgi:hypothetical protein